jgi:hypothetical protein
LPTYDCYAIAPDPAKKKCKKKCGELKLSAEKVMRRYHLHRGLASLRSCPARKKSS